MYLNQGFCHTNKCVAGYDYPKPMTFLLNLKQSKNELKDILSQVLNYETIIACARGNDPLTYGVEVRCSANWAIRICSVDLGSTDKAFY